MGIYTITEDVAFNELIELNNKTAETEIKRITGNAIAMIQGKNGQIWELLCEIDSLEDGEKKQEEQAEQILALLKEQEAVEPNPVHNSYRWFTCGKCGCSINREDRFCPRCGKAVKWE